MSLKILVVDDEPNFERLISQRFRRKIRKNEYSFVFAGNGLEALEVMNANQDIDIVLSDINMPKMDGLTFITKLHEAKVEVKTVMVSAYGDMDNIRTAMNMGAYDFVVKPINFEDLEITIQKAQREIEILRAAELAKQQLFAIQKDLTVASQIQQSILPTNFEIFPEDTPYDLCAKMIPAKEVGGDFYDFFFVDEDHLAIVIGDVSGKGMPAALFMAVSRTLLKALGLKIKAPDQCLEQVNTLLSQDNVANMFVTIFYGVLNIRTGALNYSCGGHNPPSLVHADGSLELLDKSQHIALGILEDIKYSAQSVMMEPGASLVMFTDGITEAMTDDYQFFSDERFEEFLKINGHLAPKDMLEKAIEEVKVFAGGAPQSDDITMLAIKRQQIS